MINFLQHPIKLLALPGMAFLLTITGATPTVPVPVSPPDKVSVCGVKVTLPAGSSTVKQDGALHVTLPAGYKYQGKSSAGEPLFAYDLKAAQEETDVLFYCECIESQYDFFLLGGCWLTTEEEQSGVIRFWCDKVLCLTCEFTIHFP